MSAAESPSSLKKIIRAGAIFGACVASVYFLPFVVFYGPPLLGPLQNLFYFYPQHAFPYRGFVIRNGDSAHAVFSQGSAGLLNIGQWILVGLIFALLARNTKVRSLIPLSALTIFVAVIIVQLAFYPFGIVVELDGP